MVWIKNCLVWLVLVRKKKENVMTNTPVTFTIEAKWKHVMVAAHLVIKWQ